MEQITPIQTTDPFSTIMLWVFLLGFVVFVGGMLTMVGLFGYAMRDTGKRLSAFILVGFLSFVFTSGILVAYLQSSQSTLAETPISVLTPHIKREGSIAIFSFHTSKPVFAYLERKETETGIITYVLPKSDEETTNHTFEFVEKGAATIYVVIDRKLYGIDGKPITLH